MPNLSTEIVKTAADIAAVKALFIEYLAFIKDTLNEDLSFQGTEQEFATFPKTYDALFIAKRDGVPVGACGLKGLSPKDCELKRLYCTPLGRGYNFGETLTQLTINAARKRGYSRMLLDTNPILTAANRLYEHMGFVDIAKYNDNPLACSRFMALDL